MITKYGENKNAPYPIGCNLKVRTARFCRRQKPVSKSQSDLLMILNLLLKLAMRVLEGGFDPTLMGHKKGEERDSNLFLKLAMRVLEDGFGPTLMGHQKGIIPE